MRFIIITQRQIRLVDLDSFESALEAAGLKPGEIDFGTLARRVDGSGTSIVVYQFGLFAPPEEGRYFSIGKQLFEGNAVLFAFNGEGETVDLDQPPPVMFYPSAKEVEHAIKRKKIARPETRVNDTVTWRWPDKPAP